MLRKEEVIELAGKAGVEFIHLQFTDIFGVLKNVAITYDQLGKALDGEMMFDGSSIEGFVRIEESDMYLRPDPDTFVVFPWDCQNGTAVARVICDIYNPDGTPFTGCPRNTLKKVLAEAAEMGYTMNVGPEAEFFLFKTDAEGYPRLDTNDHAGYFDLSPVDRGEDARKDMVLALQKMDFQIEASHHEVAPGQHEIDFKYADALHAADNIVTFKFVVKNIAHQHDLHATFMPKPIPGINGSGMHMNQSLFKGTENAFFDPQGDHGLSDDAMYYLGGLMKHAKALSAIITPTVNSYKRLIPGYEAPVYIAWSFRNRSPMIRVPERRGLGTRLELRNPDPSCNPYLATAVMLKAGLDGIKNKITPPPSTDANIYDLSEEERIAQGIDNLPANIKEAMEELEQDSLIREAIGEHTFNRYLDAKKIEWTEYCTQVTPWELKSYLNKY